MLEFCYFMFKNQKTCTVSLSSKELQKHEWKFGRTRNAVGTRAKVGFSFIACWEMRALHVPKIHLRILRNFVF